MVTSLMMYMKKIFDYGGGKGVYVKQAQKP